MRNGLSGIFEVPLPLDVLDAATMRCLPGYAPGWVDFTREEAGRGKIIYRLRQDELGYLGKITLSMLSDKVTRVDTDSAALPSGGEENELLAWLETPEDLRERRGQHQTKVIQVYLDRLSNDRVWRVPGAPSRPAWLGGPVDASDLDHELEALAAEVEQAQTTKERGNALIRAGEVMARAEAERRAALSEEERRAEIMQQEEQERAAVKRWRAQAVELIVRGGDATAFANWLKKYLWRKAEAIAESRGVVAGLQAKLQIPSLKTPIDRPARIFFDGMKIEIVPLGANSAEVTFTPTTDAPGFNVAELWLEIVRRWPLSEVVRGTLPMAAPGEAAGAGILETMMKKLTLTPRTDPEVLLRRLKEYSRRDAPRHDTPGWVYGFTNPGRRDGYEEDTWVIEVIGFPPGESDTEWTADIPVSARLRAAPLGDGRTSLVIEANAALWPWAKDLAAQVRAWWPEEVSPPAGLVQMGDLVGKEVSLKMNLPTFEGILHSVKGLTVSKVGGAGTLVQWKIGLVSANPHPLGYTTALAIGDSLTIRFYRMEWDRPALPKEDRAKVLDTLCRELSAAKGGEEGAVSGEIRDIPGLGEREVITDDEGEWISLRTDVQPYIMVDKIVEALAAHLQPAAAPGEGVAPSDVRAQRRHDLEDSMAKSLTMLKEYEDKLRLADDPKERARCQQEIERLKASLAEQQREYDGLGPAIQAPAKADPAAAGEGTRRVEVASGPLLGAELVRGIRHCFSVLKSCAEQESATGHYDYNVDIQDIIAELLNMVFDWRLKNLNRLNRNQPAIDLGDVDNGIAVQVTAEKRRRKIQETIDTFMDQKLYEQYSQLYFFILTGKSHYRNPFITRAGFSFDASKHILDFVDLSREIEPKPVGEIGKIARFLAEQIRDLQR